MGPRFPDSGAGGDYCPYHGVRAPPPSTGKADVRRENVRTRPNVRFVTEKAKPIMSPAIRILGRQKPITVEDGSTLLDALVAAGFSVAADCGAKGKCGRCKVKVHKGASRLPLSKAEAKRIGDLEAARGFRLACQHAAVDGLVLEVVEELYRQEVYKKLGI